jgi:FkbM family methyltransferase
LAKLLIDIDSKQPLVLDIGSNMGTFAVPVAKHIESKNGTLHCFEPQRIVYYQLCGNIFLNRIENAYVHNVALSNDVEIRQIEPLNFDLAWNIGGYSLLPNQDPQEKSSKMDACSFQKLDDFPIDGHVSLIKLDVEGMEIDVLHGGLKRLAADGFPPILFESLSTVSNSESVGSLLMSLGYQLTKYAEADWLAQHPNWETMINLIVNEGGVSYQRVK